MARVLLCFLEGTESRYTYCEFRVLGPSTGNLIVNLEGTESQYTVVSKTSCCEFGGF